MTLDGFTLFHSNRGWQLSTRERGESGWSIRFISEEDARMLLAQVGSLKRVSTLKAPTTPKVAVPEGALDLRPRRKRESLHD